MGSQANSVVRLIQAYTSPEYLARVQQSLNEQAANNNFVRTGSFVYQDGQISLNTANSIYDNLGEVQTQPRTSYLFNVDPQLGVNPSTSSAVGAIGQKTTPLDSILETPGLPTPSLTNPSKPPSNQLEQFILSQTPLLRPQSNTSSLEDILQLTTFSPAQSKSLSAQQTGYGLDLPMETTRAIQNMTQAQAAQVQMSSVQQNLRTLSGLNPFVQPRLSESQPSKSNFYAASESTEEGLRINISGSATDKKGQSGLSFSLESNLTPNNQQPSDQQRHERRRSLID